MANCRYCHKSGLIWRNIDKSWKLFSSKSKIHHCDESKPSMAPSQIKNQECEEYPSLQMRVDMFHSHINQDNDQRLLNFFLGGTIE